MASMDLSSFVKDVEKYFNSSVGKREISKSISEHDILGYATLVTDVKKSALEAADKFEDVLLDWIASYPNSVMSMNVKSALASSISVGNYVIENNDGTYTVYVSMIDLARDSLEPSKYPNGISDLAALYNNGVDHKMRQVFGFHHGDWVGSKTVIKDTHFMDEAIEEFMGNYASKYNVISIEWNRDF